MANLTHPIHPRRNACAFRVRDFEQSTGLFNPASPDRLSPPHGAGQRMQSFRVTDGAKACLRGVGASLPPLGSGAAVQIDYTPYLPDAFLAKSAFDISILPPEGLIGAVPQPRLTPPHGAGQRMQSIRVTDKAKAYLRGVGTSLPAPRFGRGGPCLGHLIHPRRNACAFRVRPFEPSTRLLSPTKPNQTSHQRTPPTARQSNQK
jgi:hypothetical protein